MHPGKNNLDHGYTIYKGKLAIRPKNRPEVSWNHFKELLIEKKTTNKTPTPIQTRKQEKLTNSSSQEVYQNICIIR